MGLSLINQSKAPLADDGWIPVSADLADVIADSLEIYQKSGGVFDISVGPLVNLWGFGPDAHPDEVPSEDVLAEAMSRTGLDVLQFEKETTKQRKTKEETMRKKGGNTAEGNHSIKSE